MSKVDLLSRFADSNSESDSENGANDHQEEEAFHEPFPPAGEFVTLISQEGVRFRVQVEVAKVSRLLANLLDPDMQFEEGVSSEVNLSLIRSVVLERVVDYMHHNYMWRTHCARMPSFQVDPAITLDTFIAADFLQL
jgi:hypothetical protein